MANTKQTPNLDSILKDFQTNTLVVGKTVNALVNTKAAIQAHYVSLLPEKKELEGLRNHTGGRGTKYKQAQGFNQAIDLMRERMEES